MIDKDLDKPAMKSKKFLAFIFTAIVLTGTLVFSLYKETSDEWLLRILSGGLACLGLIYVLGVSALESIVTALAKLKD